VQITTEVREALATVSKWIDQFNWETEQDVRAELGDPDHEAKWGSESDGGPRLDYDVLDNVTLALFICRGHVAMLMLRIESRFYE